MAPLTRRAAPGRERPSLAQPPEPLHHGPSLERPRRAPGAAGLRRLLDPRRGGEDARRLVLADALWYAQEKFKPQAIVDLATLTGAISVALGSDHAGLFSNSDDLATKLVRAGLETGEKLWRMPMGPAYDKLIESRFADIRTRVGVRLVR